MFSLCLMAAFHFRSLVMAAKAVRQRPGGRTPRNARSRPEFQWNFLAFRLGSVSLERNELVLIQEFFLLYEAAKTWQFVLLTVTFCRLVFISITGDVAPWKSDCTTSAQGCPG